MITRHNFAFALLSLSALALTHAHLPQYCAECEQEIWEQVPCIELSSTTILPSTTTDSTLPISTELPTTTTSTTVSPTLPTTNPSTLPTIPSTHPIYTTQLTLKSDITTPPSTYKKCYCDCKMGCKEFCRKAAAASPKKQITHISSTGDYAPGGEIEYTHSHQRKYYVKHQQAPSKSFKPYSLAYSKAVDRASARESNNINAPNYTLEELAKLFSSVYGTKNGLPPAQQSIYYAPHPAVSQLHPKYKQPDDKKPLIAKLAPFYESTTSYPLSPSEPLVSSESVPLPMPQTEQCPMSLTKSHKSNSIKSQSLSSSIDLAIANYLKDFGYDNQIRGLDY